MIQKIITISVIFGFVITVSFSVAVAAKPNQEKRVVGVNPSKGKATVTIPARAIEVAPGIFSLGTAMDNGKIVEGYAMVKYKKDFAKPGTICGNNICEPGENANKCPEDCADEPEEPDTSSCYSFLSKGAKWKTVEQYIVDSANTRGLDGTFIQNNVATDIVKWETAAGVNILGDEIAGIVDGADMASPDNKNELYFADIDHEGAIAVAIIWGVFGGPPPSRELVEWDMIFDDVDFDWGVGEAGKMDFENIATHELGHSVGMGDLYTTECSEVTMYGYASYAETKKQTLEAVDITGIRKLY